MLHRVRACGTRGLVRLRGKTGRTRAVTSALACTILPDGFPRVPSSGSAGRRAAAALARLLMDAAVPFVVGKTCSFTPHSPAMKVTRADVAQRVVYELGDRPILEVYAEALGKQVHEIDPDVFMTHPLGLMIDGLPWIRSPQRVLPDGGIKFYCRLREDADVHVMRSTDLVQDTHAEIERVRAALGGTLSGGLAFNCILRRLELDANNLHGPFL